MKTSPSSAHGSSIRALVGELGYGISRRWVGRSRSRARSASVARGGHSPASTMSSRSCPRSPISSRAICGPCRSPSSPTRPGDGSHRRPRIPLRSVPYAGPATPTPARRRDTCTGAKRPRAGIAGPLVWSPIFHDWPKLDGVGDRNEPAAQCGSFARLTAGAEEGQQNPHSQPRRPTSTNSTGTPGAQGA